MGQAPALQPQHLHLALDPGVRVVVTVVAYLRQHFLAESERAHGCLPAIGIDGYNHAVGIRPSYGNSASLSRGEYNITAVRLDNPPTRPLAAGRPVPGCVSLC